LVGAEANFVIVALHRSRRCGCYVGLRRFTSICVASIYVASICVACVACGVDFDFDFFKSNLKNETKSPKSDLNLIFIQPMQLWKIGAFDQVLTTFYMCQPVPVDFCYDVKCKQNKNSCFEFFP
jgi:hypothetical protein